MYDDEILRHTKKKKSKEMNFEGFFFFSAGKLPKHNNVSWRGNSCTRDGKAGDAILKDLSGGYYDAGDAIKFNYPMAFSMTMLSWSVIEYSAKYEAAGELNHVKDIIKWGTDYFLKNFNHTADMIDTLGMQVRLDFLQFFFFLNIFIYILSIPLRFRTRTRVKSFDL